jgi:hypothetical protein
MIKVLHFDDNDVSRDRFTLLYQGLCLSTKGQQARDFKQLKKEGALRRKFEAVSMPSAPPPNRFQFVERVPILPMQIEVDQEDLDLLKDYCTAVAWTPMVSDLVVDAVEWAWGAPEKERALREAARS